MRRSTRSPHQVDCAWLQKQLQQVSDMHDLINIAEDVYKTLQGASNIDPACLAEAVALCGGG
jgi:hypothetical protein